MSREVCHCPYCPRGVVSLEDRTLALHFDVSRTGGAPCEHCVSLSVSLVVYSGTREVKDLSTWWFWSLQEGLRRPERDDDLTRYVIDLMCDLVCPEDVPQGIEYRITGGTALERDAACPGSGTWLIATEDGRRLEAVLDGWGIYSTDPAALDAAVRRLARTYQPTVWVAIPPPPQPDIGAGTSD